MTTQHTTPGNELPVPVPPPGEGLAADAADTDPDAIHGGEAPTFNEHSDDWADSPGDAAFMRTFLGATVMFVLAIASFNAWVDPYGTVGTGAFPPVEAQSGERLGKVGLIEHASPPDTLVIGTSSMRMFDTRYARQAADETFFNASVSGAPFDLTYAMTAYAFEEWGHDPPDIVWGLDVEGFRRRPEQPVNDPRLRDHMPDQDRLDQLVNTIRPLVDLRTVPLSLRAIAAADDAGAGRSERRQYPGGGTRQYDATGFVREDPLAGSRLERRLPKTTDLYADTIYRDNGFSHIDAETVDVVDKLLAEANEHGVEPTLVLMPVHPAAQRELGPLGWYERRDEIRAAMRELQQHRRFRFLDFTDPRVFGGSPRQFHDNVHMTRANMRRLIAALETRDAI